MRARTLFDLNIKDVSQCVMPGVKKSNDVELQLHESDAKDQTEASGGSNFSSGKKPVRASLQRIWTSRILSTCPMSTLFSRRMFIMNWAVAILWKGKMDEKRWSMWWWVKLFWWHRLHLPQENVGQNLKWFLRAQLKIKEPHASALIQEQSAWGQRSHFPPPTPQGGERYLE